MAKNQAIKWVVGISSAVLFSGAVGLTQKYDKNTQTNQVSQNEQSSGSILPDSSNDNSSFFSDNQSQQNEQPRFRSRAS